MGCAIQIFIKYKMPLLHKLLEIIKYIDYIDMSK